jgi:hypothetical protein
MRGSTGRERVPPGGPLSAACRPKEQSSDEHVSAPIERKLRRRPVQINAPALADSPIVRAMWRWLGIREERWAKGPNEEIRPAKTAWDVLQAAVIPSH